MREVSNERAKARLEAMLAVECDPKLRDVDIAELLLDARRADRYGVEPTMDGWTPTYDLNHAAAEGWLLKASRVASLHDFQADGASYSMSQLYEHCTAQAAYYRSQVVNVGSGVTFVDVIGN